VSSNAPQGLFWFSGGIDPSIVLAAEVTQTHSMTPDTSFVQIAIDPTVKNKSGGTSLPSKNGDVKLKYGGTTIKLKNCTIDFVEQMVGDQLVWNVTILDRRYRMQDGAISGRYNVRYRNQTDIRPETKKTLKELATLCLQAMGETQWDIGKLPDDEFPEADWFYANPLESLTELCESLGFRPIFDWHKDQVQIVKPGEGAALDLSLPYEKDSLTYNPPELPGRLVVVCGPSRGQYDFDIVPKGQNPDGRILDLDELAYHPAQAMAPWYSNNGTIGGYSPLDISTGTKWDTKYWNTIGVNPTFLNVRPPYYRHLALESVYRWYQIKPPQSLPGLNRLRGDGQGANLEEFPKWNDTNATFVWQIELLNEQNDTILYLADLNNHKFDAYNKLISVTPLEAWVYGNYAYMNFGNVFVDFPGAPGSGISKLNPSLLTTPQQINAALTTTEAEALDTLLPDRLMARVAATGFYTGGFEIDSEHGLVKFNEMVYQELPFKNPQNLSSATYSDGSPIAPGSAIVPAALWLRTAFHVRDPKTRATVCYERHRVLDKNNPITKYIAREDLTYRLTFRPWKSGGGGQWQWTTEDNKKPIDEACDFILNQVEAQLLTLTPRTVSYIGLIPQRLDGAIRQVTWTIGDRGARTHVGRDTEILHIVRDYREVRMMQRLRAKFNSPTPPADPIPASQVDYSGLI
jgi:hypothetical protein